MDFCHKLTCVFFLLALVYVVDSGRHRRGCHSWRKNVCPELRSRQCNQTVYERCACTENREVPDSDDNNEDNNMPSNFNWGDFWSKRKRRDVSIHIRWGRRRHCWCPRQISVTRYWCEDKCCKGWKENKWGRCKIRANVGTQLPACKNGGSRVGSQCQCPIGFDGTLCEIATCQAPCLNGGKCDNTQPAPVCVCLNGFKGNQCQNVVCNCQNDGKCVSNYNVPTCLCLEGFTGSKCQYAEKGGTCPQRSTTGCSSTNSKCTHDSDCRDEEKCCENSCGRNMCMAPVELTCRYKDHVARTGENFKPSPCEHCICINPNSNRTYGGATCATIDCQDLSGCARSVLKEGKCCPSCIVPKTTTTTARIYTADPRPLTTSKPYSDPRPLTTSKPYSEPRFYDCPKKPLVLEVSSRGNMVYLTPFLKAYDYEDNKLRVRYSQLAFKPGFEEENIKIVFATTSPDDRGNNAQCKFVVIVKDSHPPYFETCPSNIELTEGLPAQWEEPIAKDNVGLNAKPRLVMRVPYDRIFPLGEHLVMYQVEDFEGNEANCEFLIKVLDKGMADLLNNDEDDEPHTALSHKGSDRVSEAMIIGLCSGIALLIILVLVAMYMCYNRRSLIAKRRHRHHHDHHRGHHGHHHGHHGHHHGPGSTEAYDNNIYSVPGAGYLPAYDEISIKEAPPKYTEDDVYEEVKPKVSGCDNPTYELDIDTKGQNKANEAQA